MESYSRRTGARLALSIAEPNTGDFLVKLRARPQAHHRGGHLRVAPPVQRGVPGANWEFPGILGDLIGDLMWAPKPIEIKLFSTDTAFLKKKAPEVEEQIKKIKGVVDTFDGLVYAGRRSTCACGTSTRSGSA